MHLCHNLTESGIPQKNITFLIPSTPSDDILADFLSDYHLHYVRGSEADVISRYIALAKQLGYGKTIVRLTADNPFIDARVISYCLENHQKSGQLFTSTRIVTESQEVKRSVPKGNSVDIFQTELIADVKERLKRELNAFDKEHVIPPLYDLVDVNVISANSLDFELVETISVDTKADFEKLRMIKNEA